MLPAAAAPASLALLLAAMVLLGAATAARRPGKAARSRFILRNLYLRNCNHSENYIFLAGPALVREAKDGAQLIDVDVNATRAVRKVNRMQLRINRCHEAVSYNTCEYFATWSWSRELCRLIGVPGMMWSPVLDRVTPRIKCPINKGTYQFRNASWDLDHPIIRFVEGFVWTGAFSFDDQDDVAAVCIEGAMVAVSSKA